MARRVLFLIVVLAGTAGGCDLLGPTRRTFIVQHYAAECVGAFIQRCLLVKAPSQPDFDFLYQGIEGFDYQWGFVYHIEVEEHSVSNPPADGSSIRIELRKQISRTRADPGTEFDLVLTGSAGSVVEVATGRYRLLGWPDFSCGLGVSCPDLAARLLAGKRVHFRFAHPATSSDALTVLSWDECTRTDVVFVCNP
jgi:hypothetical protein